MNMDDNRITLGAGVVDKIRHPRHEVKLGSVWTFRCFDKDGNLKWEELDVHNIWHDEGEEWICKVVFSEAQAVPASYYIGLDARASLAEADTLASLSGEPSTGAGYARSAVASDATDWTVSKVGDDWRATSTTETFTCATSNWSAVLNAFLCNVASGTSGKLLCSVALSASRTLLVGDSIQVSMYVSVS